MHDGRLVGEVSLRNVRAASMSIADRQSGRRRRSCEHAKDRDREYVALVP